MISLLTIFKSPYARGLLVAILALSNSAFAADNVATHDWHETHSFAAPEARQAAAADERYVYAISSTTVAQHDRETGKLIARSHPPAKHLNSGFFHEGQLYLAHSNYPAKPEQSEIKRLDLATLKLTTWHDFGASDGSLTWCVRDVAGAWWCNFAYYGEDNTKTYVARLVDGQEKGRWTYPARVVQAFGQKSSSGGVWYHGKLLVTGHDERELHILELPADVATGELRHVATVKAPFTGQGIAIDPVTDGLLGIDRGKRRVIFAE
ncbi:MAG: hypothetical protein KF708_12745 [Pirellulales bacterium]|nr:hypothetical protein [Pirellulales bacterium]